MNLDGLIRGDDFTPRFFSRRGFFRLRNPNILIFQVPRLAAKALLRASAIFPDNVLGVTSPLFRGGFSSLVLKRIVYHFVDLRINLAIGFQGAAASASPKSRAWGPAVFSIFPIVPVAE